MNKKEYRNAVDQQTAYKGIWCDYLTRDELKDLRKDMKERKKRFNVVVICNGKASVYTYGNTSTLTSYYTDVARIDIERKTFTRLWHGFSVTTLKHVNAFLTMHQMKGFNKREWIELEVGKEAKR